MKKIIQTIYGMQYEELEAGGKDGNKARFNGNILVAAFLMLFLFLMIVALTHVPEYNDKMNRTFHGVFGYWSGKAIGKILAIPLMAALYYLVTLTIGSERLFQEHVQAYRQFTDEEKKKSLSRVMIPFMSMLVLLLILSLI